MAKGNIFSKFLFKFRPILRLYWFINNSLDLFFDLRIQPTSAVRLSKTRREIFQQEKVNQVIDVGANLGQYVAGIRSEGFQGNIISFEPTEIFDKLQEKSKNDPKWEVFQKAVSNYSGKSKIYLASNSFLSSSLKKPEQVVELHNINFEISEQEVSVIRLTDFLERKISQNAYLKIDVQGGEMDVLLGAEAILGSFKYIEFESALVQLYEGEVNHYKIANWLQIRGYEPLQLVVTDWNSAGRTISLDAIFERSERL